MFHNEKEDKLLLSLNWQNFFTDDFVRPGFQKKNFPNLMPKLNKLL